MCWTVILVAHSPQAKGRVERNHGVYQDRFVKELRLAGIVLQFERRLYRIPRRLRHRPQPGGRVMVRKWLDSSLHFYWKHKPLLIEEPYSTPTEGGPGCPVCLT